MDTTTAARPEAAAPRPEGRPLISLFSDLWRETSTLVHDEVELARTEISEKVTQVSSGVAEIAIAGGILFAGFLILLFAASNGLAQVLPPELAPWLAPLIVGAVVVVIGLIALARGRSNLKAENLKPGRTLESLRRDRELVKEHIK